MSADVFHEKQSFLTETNNDSCFAIKEQVCNKNCTRTGSELLLHEQCIDEIKVVALTRQVAWLIEY